MNQKNSTSTNQNPSIPSTTSLQSESYVQNPVQNAFGTGSPYFVLDHQREEIIMNYNNYNNNQTISVVGSPIPNNNEIYNSNNQSNNRQFSTFQQQNFIPYGNHSQSSNLYSSPSSNSLPSNANLNINPTVNSNLKLESEKNVQNEHNKATVDDKEAYEQVMSFFQSNKMEDLPLDFSFFADQPISIENFNFPYLQNNPYDDNNSNNNINNSEVLFRGGGSGNNNNNNNNNEDDNNLISSIGIVNQLNKVDDDLNGESIPSDDNEKGKSEEGTVSTVDQKGFERRLKQLSNLNGRLPDEPPSLYWSQEIRNIYWLMHER